MTEQISLNLTLEELEIIDKYVELNDNTRQLFDKIRSAYPKLPVEVAYKRVYGEYPPTTSSVDNHIDIRWSAFQGGYYVGYEDGLENSNEKSQEPVEKPESLEDILWEWWEEVFTTNSNDDMETTLADLADRVYSWHKKL